MSHLTDPNLRDSQDQGSSHITESPNIKKSEEAGKQSSATLQPYSISILNPSETKLSADFIKNAINQANQAMQSNQSNHGQTTVIIYNTTNCHSSKEDEKEEDVSEEFVKDYNEHFGNKENQEKAARLLKKMQVLGGLIPNTPLDQIDIPSARMGLAILAGINNKNLKMEALKSLQKILKDDPITKDTAIDLVSLTIKLLKRMDRELLQTEILDVQNEIAKTYGAVAELVLHHYAKQHINAITKELKVQLTISAKALEDLNRQEDPHLAYEVRFALEGILRVKDDSKALLEILNRIYYFALATAAFANQDAYSSVPILDETFKDIIPHLKHNWYAAAVMLHELAKNAKTDRDSLLVLQSFVGQEHKGLNWRFLYEAIKILGDITITGKDEKIRQTAFEGMRALSPVLPGVSSFASFNGFKVSTDMSPILYMKAPKTKNRSVLIRALCIENLIKISKESPDPKIRRNAKEILLLRLRKERFSIIKNNILKNLPKDPKKYDDWLEENGKYAQDAKGLANDGKNPPKAKTKGDSSGSIKLSSSLEKTIKHTSSNILAKDNPKLTFKNLERSRLLLANTNASPSIYLTPPSPKRFGLEDDSSESETSKND